MELGEEIKVRDLARELGFGKSRDPVNAIQLHCEKRIKEIIQAFPGEIHTLNQIFDYVEGLAATRN